MRAASVRQGEIVADHYRVDRVIGSGAMGVVLAATDLKRNVTRALKVMAPGAAEDREAVARFLREAKAAMRLRGEHVARVLKVGRLDDGAPFMVMEHLAGKDLREVIEERGALPPAEAVALVLQVCEALAEAHSLGIVHRDLKPANLFVVKGPGGAPSIKVLDFGVSKILGDAASTGDTTRADVMIGSPHYMSPEQMRSSRDVDARTDVWALGVVAYQLLTGRLPFDGDALPQIVSAVLEGHPEPPSSLVKDLPPALSNAVLRCLTPDRDRRCPSVVDLAASLQPFASPPPRRLPTALLIAVAFALGCAIAILLLRR